MKNEFKFLNDVKTNFSLYENVILSEEEKTNMKNIIKKHKKISPVRIAALAACLCAVIAFSQTTLAKDFVNGIIRSFSTGFNSFYQYDSSELTAQLPPALQGLVFDENGNEVTHYNINGRYFNKDGAEITDFKTFMQENIPDVYEYTDANGNSVKVSFSENADDISDPLARSIKMGYPAIYDEAEIADYLNFTPKLPTYIPDGFSFYGASAYGTDYLFVHYKNTESKYITVHERILNEETAFSAGTDGNIEKTTVNGYDAVIMSEKNINWEQDGLSVGINGFDGISKDELLKIAESVR